jgi:hypothetical protein
MRLFVLPLIGALSLGLVWRNLVMFMIEMTKDYPDMKTMMKESDFIVEVIFFPSHQVK